MNVAACLLGVLLVSSSARTVVIDLDRVNGVEIDPTAFAPSCGIRLIAACRLSGTRTNWSVTAWAPDGLVAGLTTQRDVDAFPVAVTSQPWPAAYRTLTVQRTTIGAQWLEVRAIRADGCQTTMRVTVTP